MKYKYFLLLTSTIVIIISSWSSVFSASYLGNTWFRNCDTSSSVLRAPWQKQVPIANQFTASPTWTFNCETHGYWWDGTTGWSWSSWVNKWTIYTCPANWYAAEIECRDGGISRPCTTDGVNWNRYRVLCQEIDDIPPSIDIDDLGGFVIANDTHYIPIDYGVDQSWPWLFTASIEDYNNLSASLPVWLTSNGFNINLSLVDGSDRTTWNYRPYTLSLNQVCDEAWNCISGLPSDYTYNVYAADVDSGNSNLSSLASLSAGDVADGRSNMVIMTLSDTYWNDIVPVPGVWRVVSAYVDYTNSLYLDQYSLSGISGVDVNAIPTNIWVNQTYTQNNSVDGVYEYDFQIYSPTSWYSEGEWDFSINRFYAGVSDITWTSNIGWSSVFDFRPLYTSIFSGDIVDDSFFEWVTQSSSLNAVRDIWSSALTTVRSLRTEFWEVSWAGINIPNSRYGITLNSAPVAEWNQVSWSSTTQLRSALPSNNNIETFMSQQGSVFTSPDTYLASIIKYNIATKTIVYPSAIIWKDTYHGNPTWSSVVDGGIKITGNTSSQNVQEVLENQFTNDVRILWDLTKSTFKKDIERQVYSVIRNQNPKTIGSLSISSSDLSQSLWSANRYDIWNTWSRGISLFWDKVLYFWDGSTVILNWAANIEWEKTLVVENADLYINSDIENTDNDGILWIIVINGDILIDNRVNDIHATMYTNQSILSTTFGIYNNPTNNYLDGTAELNQLSNQLYIRWSVFSENTIWWSRKPTAECPYYVALSDCVDIAVAQAYDLNYLRRYFMRDLLPAGAPDGVVDTPSWDQSRANGQSWFDEFPVIIDYNPLIQITPPPFFN